MGAILVKLIGANLNLLAPVKTNALILQTYYLLVWPILCLRHGIAFTIYNDHPWIKEKLRNLIKLRQQAFASGNLTLFKFYRNKVNRQRKIYRANYYTTKVNAVEPEAVEPKELVT